MKISGNSRFFFTIAIMSCLLMIFILPSPLKAQRGEEENQDQGGLQYGLDFGLYLPNRYPANYYNGSDGNVNNIKFIFSNETYNNEIKQALNVSDTSKFFLKECPTNMRYPATPSAGLYISYNFNRSTGVYLQFNYVKLKPHDVFTVEVSPQDEILTTPDLRLFSISGEEERINIDLGYSRAFRVRENMDIMGEAGIAINDIKVLKSRIYIVNKEYSLINVYGNKPYVPGSNMQAYDIVQGGIGIGLHGGAGIRFNFSESFALQPGATLYWNNVNLEGYKDMRFSPFFYLRFIARKLL
jgi:hypothetical protein